LVWTGKKPKTGLQEAARARAMHCFSDGRKIGAGGLRTAHTRDDQAETLASIARGGIGGLRAPPQRERDESCCCVRFSMFPKARLVATLRQAAIPLR